MQPQLTHCRNLLAQGQIDHALAMLQPLAEQNSDCPETWALWGEALLHAGQLEPALSALQHARQLAPEQAGTYTLLREAWGRTGQMQEAVLAGIAAEALTNGSAQELFKLGTVYFLQQQRQEAEFWYQLAATLDPVAIVQWHRNLSINLWGNGRIDEAQYQRDAAFKRQSVFIISQHSPHAILMLCTGGRGDVPVDHLINPARYALTKWVIEYGQEEHLPPFTLVFNGIGDPDMQTGQLQAEVADFLQRCHRPLLNHPEQIARTSREQLPALLQGIANIEVPSVQRLATTPWPAHITVPFPLLLRPIGSHGGDLLTRVDTASELEAFKPMDGATNYYATHFHDFRSADGYYRKYRVIFVDRHPYPYHLAIADQWLVHYETADMEEVEWKLVEEQKFLGAPEQAIRPAAWAAITAIGQQIDLDYAGIDFSILPDGRILVFEANATMLVHPVEPDGPLHQKTGAIQRIQNAFEALLNERAQW